MGKRAVIDDWPSGAVMQHSLCLTCPVCGSTAVVKFTQVMWGDSNTTPNPRTHVCQSCGAAWHYEDE